MLLFLVFSQSPSLPPTPNSVPPNANTGVFAFPSGMLQTAKQKSAFNPVSRAQLMAEGNDGVVTTPTVVQGEKTLSMNVRNYTIVYCVRVSRFVGI